MTLRRIDFSLFDLVTVLPLLLAIVWLPLFTGGSEAGPQALVQITTLAALSVLAFLRRLSFTNSRPAAFTVGVLVVAALVATVFSQDLDESVPALLQWLWLAAAALLTLHATQRPRMRTLLLGALVAAATVQASWSFFVWWGGGEAAPAQSGTFYAPNQFAGYLLLLAPLLLAMALLRPSRREAVAWGVMATFVYLAIALSGSRGGGIAAILGALVAVVLAARSGLKKVLVRSVLLVGGFIAGGAFLTSSLIFPTATPGAPDGTRGALRSIAAKGQAAPSLEMRLRWSQGALLIGLRHPLTGSGLGTFGDVFVEVQDPRWFWSEHAHNHYLEAFAEGGLLLLAGTTLLPLLALAAGYRNLDSESPDRGGQIGLFAGLAGASAHLIIDHDWSFPAFAVTYLIVATILAVAPASSRSENEVPRPVRRPLSGAAGGVLAILTLAAMIASSFATLLETNSSDPPDTLLGPLRLATRLAPFDTAPRKRLAEQLSTESDPMRLREAATVLRGAARLDELDPRLQWQLASLYDRLGDLKAARSAYRRATSLARNSPTGYLLAAQFEIESARDPAAASRILDAGIRRLKLRPNRPQWAVPIAQLLLARSVAEERLSGPATALSYAVEAVDVSPRSGPPRARVIALACAAGLPLAGRLAVETAGPAAVPPAAIKDLAALFERTCGSLSSSR